MYKKECKWCEEIIIVEKQPNFASHVASCKMNPNLEKRKAILSLKNKGVKKVERVKLEKKCPKCNIIFKIEATESEIRRNKVNNYCSRKCGNSRVHSEETKNKISKSLQGNIPKNKGKIKIYESNCLKCGEVIFSNVWKKDRKYHKECWLSISGGIKIGSVKNYKSGYYKGFWCDSSYELAFLIYCIEHNINIERNKKGFEYFYEDKKHLYYPDFIVNDEYVEIKNYKSELTDAKISYFPYKIKVYYKENMRPYLDYVKSKYGKNFIELYD
jgi:hypothetical protein